MYKLKQVPEDFTVKERIRLEIKDKGEYAYFTLEKKNWDSLKAVAKMAQRLNVDKDRFAMAGQKDKNAFTIQYMSGWRITRKQLEWLNIRDIKIKFVGYGDEKIRLGSLDGNDFEITVRNLDAPITTHGKLAVPNYYGEQRFGGEQRPNTAVVGKWIVKKDLEKAMKAFLGEAFDTETDDYKKARDFLDKNWGKWKDALKLFPERMFNERNVLQYLIGNGNDYVGAFKALPKQLMTMFVHAYQALIWNKTLAACLMKYGHFEEGYCMGKLIFPKVKVPDVDIPIVGSDTQIPDPNIMAIVDSVLNEDGIRQEDFAIKEIPALSSKGLERPSFIEVDFKLGKPENDNLNKDKLKQKVYFSLPKGSYATIALRLLLH